MQFDWKTGLPPFFATGVMLIGWVVQPWGKLGNILFFFLTGLTVILGILLLQKKNHELHTIREAEKVKRVLSMQRHDFLNHVQVLMGYQTLKKPERIASYLQKLVQEAGHERNISEIHYPPLAVTLLTLSHEYKQWDWNVRINDRFQLPSMDQEKDVLSLIQAFFPWLANWAKSHSDWTKIRLALSQEDQQAFLTVEMFSDDGSIVSFPVSEMDWEQINKELKKWKGQVEPLHENQGWLITY